MQALALMKTLGSAPMRDDLCAECMHAHRSAPLATLTSVRWYLAGDAAPGGRTTKASQPRRAIQGNLHKHADNVLLTRGGKETRKRGGMAKTGAGRKIRLWKRKGTVKSFVTHVREREDVGWMKTVKLITPAVRDASSIERNDGKERLCGPRQDGWGDGSGMLCHLVERAV